VQCWEFNKCGDAKKHNCPAFPNAGSHCASLAGTICFDIPPLTFEQKYSECSNCNFFKSKYYDPDYDGSIKNEPF
jgi:hypothetical protein